jgi:hypothetical protein
MRLVIASCLAAVLLTGCAQKSAFEDLADGACTNKQAQLVDEHISGQIDAIAKRSGSRLTRLPLQNLERQWISISSFLSSVQVMGC